MHFIGIHGKRVCFYLLYKKTFYLAILIYILLFTQQNWVKLQLMIQIVGIHLLINLVSTASALSGWSSHFQLNWQTQYEWPKRKTCEGIKHYQRPLDHTIMSGFWLVPGNLIKCGFTHSFHDVTYAITVDFSTTLLIYICWLWYDPMN